MPNQARSLSLRRGGGDCQQTTLPGTDTPSSKAREKKLLFLRGTTKAALQLPLGKKDTPKAQSVGDRSEAVPLPSAPCPNLWLRSRTKYLLK